MVNAGGCGQWVAPFGGIAKRIGTNPISIGVPTGEGDPIVVDIATSTAPEGKIRALHNKGAKVPEGLIIDHEGAAGNEYMPIFTDLRRGLCSHWAALSDTKELDSALSSISWRVASLVSDVAALTPRKNPTATACS